MIITLTPDLEQALATEARKLGRTPEQLALDSLRERFLSPESDLSPKGEQATLADFLSGHLGVLHSSEHVPGGHACPKTVDASLSRPSAPSTHSDGHDAHRCGGLGSPSGCG
jgi:hypothetical protein